MTGVFGSSPSPRSTPSYGTYNLPLTIRRIDALESEIHHPSLIGSETVNARRQEDGHYIRRRRSYRADNGPKRARDAFPGDAQDAGIIGRCGARACTSLQEYRGRRCDIHRSG